ncbi:MAG: hypothetical protein OXC45_08520 [Gemmatimonadetes bacterium]|nr:hypothetical protein [Gemmatimonadota bacterium]
MLDSLSGTSGVSKFFGEFQKLATVAVHWRNLQNYSMGIGGTTI